LYGDSGGALTTLHFPRRSVGVVSWGPLEFGRSHYPAVYSKVSAVLDWILNRCGLFKIPREIFKADAIT